MNIIHLVYRSYRQDFGRMLVLTAISGGLGVGILSYINNHLLQNNQIHTHGILPFLLFVMIYLLAATWAQIQLARMGQHFIFDMQMQLVKRIMDSHDAQLQHIGKARILASLANDIRSLSIAFTRLPELVQGVLLVTVCSLYLIVLSFKLFLITAFLMLLMVLGTHFVVKKHYGSFRAMRRAEDEMQHHYETVLNGHKELKLNRFRAERFYRESFQKEAQNRRDAHIHADAYHAMAINWGNSVMLVAVGLIFYLSTHHGWASLSEAATITMTVLFMRAPLTAAIGAFPAMMQSQVAWQALNRLGLDNYHAEFHGKNQLPKDWQTIRLENMTYDYPVQGGQHFGLKPINLTLKRGETVFLIGGNGSGKSTLSMVLAGLYLPTSGKIFVDDIEIQDENRDAYRQLFSSVFTDFHLFEQLMDGEGKDVSAEWIQNWLQHLHLDEKVKIEQNQILNKNLSQGQRKRLGLLVAALEQRSIMILDEWAADQDPQFRRIFYENILPLLKNQGYTVFAISHDDKYFHHAQRMISMKNGELSEYDASAAQQVVQNEH